MHILKGKSDVPSCANRSLPFPLVKENIRLCPGWGNAGWLCASRDLPRESFSAVASITRFATPALESDGVSPQVDGRTAFDSEIAIGGGLAGVEGGPVCSCWAMVLGSGGGGRETRETKDSREVSEEVRQP